MIIKFNYKKQLGRLILMINYICGNVFEFKTTFLYKN